MRRQGRGGLEIDDHPRFQELVWAWQRAAWAAIAATLAAALLGLFGGGLFGEFSAADPGGRLRVRGERFGRREGRTDLEMEFHLGPGGEPRIWIGRGYLDAVDVEGVSPAPSREAADESGATYVFEVPSGPGPGVARFRLKPRRIGRARGLVRLDDGPEVAFWQFIHP